ncbi:histidine kinase [Lentzea sp. NPDC051838]|uniref:sensor histidine kinase n=1 Tax=Lentzea sp. NPDC051838 TaxID=3154849 RepID=UPI003434EEE3
MSSALAFGRTQLDPMAIGQEIHDLIGHKLSLMVLHAGALELAAGSADEHAAAIREAGTSAIAGLRRIVALLCEESDLEQVEFDANAALTTLVDASRRAGLPVRLTADELGQVEPEVSQVVLSLVREALTNIHKHAGAVPTEVRVVVASSQVFVEVVNQPSRGAVAADRLGTQRGLRGMRELVGWRGGYLSHAPTPEGGFRVRAVLPL